MGHKILLVEDDPCFGSVLKSYLELSDYDVIHCTNGVDGFEAFRKEKFDLCLLDVMMPEMDGFTLGKKIRELDVTVPFVYMYIFNESWEYLMALSIKLQTTFSICTSSADIT